MHKRPLLTYIALAYLWTWVTVLPLLLQKRGLVDLGLPDAWEAVGAFGPLVAAWLGLRRTEGPARPAAFWRSLTNWRLGGRAWSLPRCPRTAAGCGGHRRRRAGWWCGAPGKERSAKG